MSKKDRIIAVDFGATFVKLAKLNIRGRILERFKLVTGDFKSKKALMSAIITSINSLIGKERKRILGVGFGIPGPVDYNKGVVYNLTNVKGWRNVPLKTLLSKSLKLPVVVDNDANAACLGEAEWGAAKGYKNIECITLGSGVGGGLIIDSEIYRGRGYSAGRLADESR